MGASTVKTFNQIWKKPFQFEGTAMHPNVLLMCKLTVLLIVAHHFIEDLSDPFIPFFDQLNIFNSIPGALRALQVFVFIVAAVLLFLNYKVRTASITLGIVVIFSIIISVPMFKNHTFICGCALFLAGLTDNKKPPYLLILQLSLIYFGASINKFFEPDWWSGAFMHNWLAVARGNELYLSTSALFPDFWFAKLLSHIAMGTEFLIGVTLLFKKTRNKAIWFIIVFHVLLFSITGFRFGHFIESLLIFLIAIVNWPNPMIYVEYYPEKASKFKSFLTLLDFDNKWKWQPSRSESTWLSVKAFDKTYTNLTAVKKLILWSPNVYIILFAIDCLIYIILHNHRILLALVNICFAWALIFFFSPLFKLPSTKNHSTI
ncbi:MAG: hypothetical protein BM564_06755 [Bacteroidetes bacterium MedPE-SWsnd-G2]|nr:MAG: hypothetical protein BM564_06755 [Bacteroidetes bacterium MedPE-SWsnd-G2]